MRGVVGLDLSMTNTGMCYIPPEWDGNIESLSFSSFGTKKSDMTFGKRELITKDELMRYISIANKVVGFIRKNKADRVVVEDYAYSKGKTGSSSVTKLCELGGTVKTQLVLVFKSTPVVLSASSARKSICGSLKRSKPKEQLEELLRSFGFRFNNYDEMDAFVVGYAFYCEINRVISKFKPECLYEF